MRDNTKNGLGVSVLITLVLMAFICLVCFALVWQFSGMIILGMPIQFAIITIFFPVVLSILIYRFCNQLEVLPPYEFPKKDG